MPVAVNQVRAREEKDPLDTILKGLSIAQGIYGIKEAGDKAELLKSEQAAKRENEAFQKAVGQGQLLKAGYEAKKDDSGEYQLHKIEGFRDIENEKTRAEIDKLNSEIEKNKREGAGLSDRIKEYDLRIRAMQLQEHDNKLKQAAFDKTSEGKLQKLNSGDKQRFDNARSALSAVEGMTDALINKNQNTKTLVGDNDFTMNNTLFSEALGRMQSGGAISKAEEERFKSMAPTIADTKEIQVKKLIKLQNEMSTRMQSFGINPEDVGIKKQDISALAKQRGYGAGFFNNEAVTSQGGTLQDQASQILIQRKGMGGRMPNKL